MIDYLNEIRSRYSEKHRKYHTIEHVVDMLEYCKLERPGHNPELWYAILWHDAVYNPMADDNEEQSALAWLQWSSPSYNSGYEDIDREKVANMIRATANPFKVLREADDYNVSIDKDLYDLIRADFNIFTKSKKELIAYEEGIFYEFQQYPLNDYIKGRTEVLRHIQGNYARAEVEYSACEFLIDYINNKTYKVGVYAGSFNPYHIGHEDVVLQAEEQFDKVIIAQGYNRDKEKPPIMKGNFRQVIYYDTMLIDLFKDEPQVHKTLIRGLRNSFDVGYEDNLRNTLFDFKQIPVVYFFCKKEHEHISSSMIRGLIPFGKEAYERYLCPEHS